MNLRLSSQVLLPSSSGFSFISQLDLDSELDLDMDLHPVQTTTPSQTPRCLAPFALSSRSTLLTTFLTRHHMALTSSLTFSFPQNLKLERLHSNSRLHLDRRLDGDPSPYLWVVQDKC